MQLRINLKNEEYGKVKRKELNTSKGEMKQFREHTFKRLNQLMGRNDIGPSSCQTTSEVHMSKFFCQVFQDGPSVEIWLFHDDVVVVFVLR